MLQSHCNYTPHCTPAIYVTRAYVTPLTTHWLYYAHMFYFASRDAHARHLMVTMWSFSMYNIVNTYMLQLRWCIVQRRYIHPYMRTAYNLSNEFRFQIKVVEFVELLVYWKSCLWPGLLDRKMKNIWDIDVCIRLGSNAFEFDVRVRKVRGFCSSSS